MTNDPATPAIDPDNPPQVDAPKPTGAICANCATPLFGEHCYHCGQPVKGLVRRFTSVIGDVADTLFEIDTRLTRTVVPLLLRPGYLSIEYFAGRRVRYVSPVRLFFFLSVMAFFVAQWSVNQNGGNHIVQMDGNSVTNATTVAEVEHRLDLALNGLHQGEQAVTAVPGVAAKMAAAEVKLRKQAEDRIAEIKAAQAAGKPPPDHSDPLSFDDDGKPWDPVAHPFKSNALPAFANNWVNQLAIQTKGNVERIRQDPNLLLDAWLSAMPSTLFLLLPLFAVLLKMTYLFKRRLYMEHFIVALHSHAFLCFALLLALLLNGLAAVTPSPWLHTPMQVAKVALIVWMPLYLLLMQKRVYQQGWIMTLLKYGVLAIVYILLLSVGALASLAVKLVWL